MTASRGLGAVGGVERRLGPWRSLQNPADLRDPFQRGPARHAPHDTTRRRGRPSGAVGVVDVVTIHAPSIPHLGLDGLVDSARAGCGCLGGEVAERVRDHNRVTERWALIERVGCGGDETGDFETVQHALTIDRTSYDLRPGRESAPGAHVSLPRVRERPGANSSMIGDADNDRGS